MWGLNEEETRAVVRGSITATGLCLVVLATNLHMAWYGYLGLWWAAYVLTPPAVD